MQPDAKVYFLVLLTAQRDRLQREYEMAAERLTPYRPLIDGEGKGGQRVMGRPSYAILHGILQLIADMDEQIKELKALIEKGADRPSE